MNHHTMLTSEDKIQIASRGSHLADVEQQLAYFKKGFPYLNVLRPATLGDGIIKLEAKKSSETIACYMQLIEAGLKPVKFVPASGAASRMFQILFAFSELADTNDKAYNLLQEEQFKNVNLFFDQLSKFAFYKKLIAALDGELMQNGRLKYVEILDMLLSERGLNYGFLPKGLLDFHNYLEGARTPVEEHMVEGALYSADKSSQVKLHFTVSPEHLKLFKQKIEEKKLALETRYGVNYDITFSEQKPYTDTIAVDQDNQPFRLNDNKLLFRPAGHGALLDNLNDVDGDILFIKNIDNIVPDRLKEETTLSKMGLTIRLVEYQKRIFNYLNVLDSKTYSQEELQEIKIFATEELNISCPIQTENGPSSLATFLVQKLNRPIRVCGMVKNEGEPGGGPFWAENSDGSTSLQVVESSQIDPNNSSQKLILSQATHFNPVDLICGVRDYKGDKFDLMTYRDPETGFISTKSKDGKTLKAQELPGLWNGAMADWITLFVEVPIITFNPVKTINDLLRQEHQPV